MRLEDGTIETMAGSAQRPSMSYAEFLAHEETSGVRHEYLRGETFAMAGGTPEHAVLCASLMGELRTRLTGGPCRVFSSDLRVRIEETDFSCYPDITVVCGDIQRSAIDKNAVTNPSLVIEVLSESTEAHDRGAKMAHYRQISSLREIVLVSQEPPRIEVWRRAGKHFEVFDWQPGEAFELATINVKIPVADVYRDLPVPLRKD